MASAHGEQDEESIEQQAIVHIQTVYNTIIFGPNKENGINQSNYNRPTMPDTQYANNFIKLLAKAKFELVF